MAYAAPNLNPLQTTGLGPPCYCPQTPGYFPGNPALGRLDSMNGLSLPGANPFAAPQVDANTLLLQTQTQMLQAMIMLLATLMQNSSNASSNSGSSSGADNSATSAISNDGGSASTGSNGSVSGSSGASGVSGSSASASSGVTGGGASASVDMAKQYLGNSAISLKGKLANYTAAGGTGNDCADFVSAILANTQGFKKKPGDAAVSTLKQDLLAQGWRKVSKAESKAGDVVIFNGSQHVELVSKDGGKEAIGSNGGATNQVIKTDSLAWGSQEFFHKG